MRISITVVCVAVFATFPLSSGRANDASAERRIEDRLARARHRIDDVMLNSADAKELIKKSRVYIARAETALANHHSAFAGPLSEAADALSRSVDHVVRSRDISRTDYPSRQRLSNRLDTVGLRVQQANYFQKLGGDSASRALVGLARRYNERASDPLKVLLLVTQFFSRLERKTRPTPASKARGAHASPFQPPSRARSTQGSAPRNFLISQIAAVGLMIAIAASLPAQLTTADVVGKVADQTGSVVPAAKITVGAQSQART